MHDSCQIFGPFFIGTLILGGHGSWCHVYPPEVPGHETKRVQYSIVHQKQHLLSGL